MLNEETDVPQIKVNGDIIVDGNHRYIAGQITGVEIPKMPYPGGRPDRVVDWDNVIIEDIDWR